MKQEIEIEFKNLLTKSEFEQLKNAFPFPSEAAKQTNHYFETPDFQLKDRGSALRIREKNDGYVLTLKEPYGDGLLETHDRLTKEEAESWLRNEPIEKPNVETRLKRLGVEREHLQYGGSLTTYRRELEMDEILLVLDHSMYNGQEDYELELEAKSLESGQNVFQEMLKKYSIPERKTPNKIERFFKSVGWV